MILLKMIIKINKKNAKKNWIHNKTIDQWNRKLQGRWGVSGQTKNQGLKKYQNKFASNHLTFFVSVTILCKFPVPFSSTSSLFHFFLDENSCPLLISTFINPINPPTRKHNEQNIIIQVWNMLQEYFIYCDYQGKYTLRN